MTMTKKWHDRMTVGDVIVAVSKDGSWPDFKSWNEEYTKLLQKRNAAERAWNAERDPVKRAKLEEKFKRLDATSEAHRSDPNRPSSTATFAFGSRR